MENTNNTYGDGEITTRNGCGFDETSARFREDPRHKIHYLFSDTLDLDDLNNPEDTIEDFVN